eukprot:GHVU01110213.1.p1 GENE.GHVU01110213.1~~GHVU01110213.1.p1  ORF type:complete len:278 (-),score=36.52 GHVU01110213.1:136-861(-)
MVTPLTADTDCDTGEYTFTVAGLQAVAESMWTTHQDELVRNPGLLCTVQPAVVPADGGGNPLLLCEAADTAVAGGAASKCPCKLCGVGVKRSEMRAHVGSHILQAVGVTHTPRTCGFCGGNDCNVQLKGSGKSKPPKIEADCCVGYAENFQYNAAKDLRRRALCSNIPLKCGECVESGVQPQTYWKYNMRLHWEASHRDMPIPEEFSVDAREELKRMRTAGISADGGLRDEGGDEDAMECE